MHGTSVKITSVLYPHFPSRSAVGVVTMLRAERSASPILVDLSYFSLLQNVQTGSGAHPIGTGDLPPGGNSAGSRVWTHLHLVPRLRIRGDTPPISIYAFMACVGRTGFFFTLPSFITSTKRQLWCYDNSFPPFPVLVALIRISNLHSNGRKKTFFDFVISFFIVINVSLSIM